MKRILYIYFTALVLASCASSKNYLERTNEDKALSDAVKKLSKNPSDENALQAVPVLYTNIQKNHLAKIKDLKESKELNHWDKIINEYQDLQDAYDAIINNSAAFKLVIPRAIALNCLMQNNRGLMLITPKDKRCLTRPAGTMQKKHMAILKKQTKLFPDIKMQ